VPSTLVASRLSLRTRLARLGDRVIHPRLTRELAQATREFSASGVVRVYPNSPAGRRLEAREIRVLTRHGYQPPIRGVHEAIWSVGGPVITITFSREVVPAVLSDRARELAARRGVIERR
jgi:hypothetical protein